MAQAYVELYCTEMNEYKILFMHHIYAHYDTLVYCYVDD